MAGLDIETQAFIDDVSGFCTKHGFTDSAFGRAALGDPNFMREVRNGGRSPSLGTVAKVRRFMQQYGGA